VRLRCDYDPDTSKGQQPEGRKVRGIIHWVPASCAVKIPVTLYSPLFTSENPDQPPEGQSFLDLIDPDSKVDTEALGEPALGEASAGDRFQFERIGYFHVDPVKSLEGSPHFNRIAALRDSWAKQEKSNS